MTLRWLHCDIMLTFCWPRCVNSVATPILPCSPVRKSIHHRPWAESSWSGPLWSTSQHPLPVSAPLALGPAFFDLWPLHLACEPTAFPALWSYFDESHDHAFALRAVMEASRCHVHNTEPSDSTRTPIIVFVRSIDGKKNEFKTFSDLLIFYVDNFVFCCFKNLKKGFSFTWISCFRWPRLELMEDQYKQSTHAVNTHSNLSARPWTGPLL